MKKKVAIVGATGIAGQQFISALQNHPWYEIAALAGSERSAGKTYEESLRETDGRLGWWQPEPLPAHVRHMKMHLARELDITNVDIVFVAVESAAAYELEPLYAKYKPTISTASAHRMAEDVPLLIPGVNDAHREMIRHQQKKRGWKGFVVPIPNCTTYGLACSLAPLQKRFGVKAALVTSMQAASGAGRNGGVLALDLIDNLIPHIPGEEQKVEHETQKILGKFAGSEFNFAPIKISATCTRVPITDGHTEAVFVATEKPCTEQEARQAFLEYQHGLEGLPSAPKHFFAVHDDPFQPQPRMMRDWDGGMPTHIGRLRDDHVLGGVKYVLLSHNTKAGAAKGAILVAESLQKAGFI